MNDGHGGFNQAIWKTNLLYRLLMQTCCLTLVLTRQSSSFAHYLPSVTPEETSPHLRRKRKRRREEEHSQTVPKWVEERCVHSTSSLFQPFWQCLLQVASKREHHPENIAEKGAHEQPWVTMDMERVSTVYLFVSRLSPALGSCVYRPRWSGTARDNLDVCACHRGKLTWLKWNLFTPFKGNFETFSDTPFKFPCKPNNTNKWWGKGEQLTFEWLSTLSLLCMCVCARVYLLRNSPFSCC